VTAPLQFLRDSKSGGTTPHDCHAPTGRRNARWFWKTRSPALPIRAKRFQFADVDRAIVPANGTRSFAQNFLRTQSPAHFRQVRSRAKNIRGVFVLALFDGKQCAGNIIAQRARDDAQLRDGQ
jgi:hypothetical protein